MGVMSILLKSGSYADLMTTSLIASGAIASDTTGFARTSQKVRAVLSGEVPLGDF